MLVKVLKLSSVQWFFGLLVLYLVLGEIGLVVGDLGTSKEVLDLLVQTIKASENGVPYLLGGGAIAAACGGFGYMIGGWRGMAAAVKLSPKPPEVTPENCFEY